jgi:hypothetical protein
VLAVLWVSCAEPTTPPSTASAENIDALKTPLPSAPVASAVPMLLPQDAGPACSDELASGELARLSCDGSRILVRGAIVAHPRRSLPSKATRKVLSVVAKIMRAHPELLMLRVEVFSSQPATSAPAERRAIFDTQARADAMFRYLWRREKISAERLEPVGRGAVAPYVGAAERWPTLLRIVQRR